MSGTDQRDDIDASGSALTAALDQLLAVFRRGIELDLCVSKPGRVLSYNPALQRADVQLEQLPVVSMPDGSAVPLPPIILPSVPVSWPATLTGYCLPPMAVGTTGHVVFLDRALSVWLKTGVASDPINGRTHNLADGVFVPGVHPDTAPIASPMHVAGTHTVVHGPLLALREGATSPLVSGTAYLAAFGAFFTSVAAAFSTWNTATGGVPAAATPAVNGAFILALGNAAATLATAILGTVSTTVFTT